MMVATVLCWLVITHLILTIKYRIGWREACVGTYLAFFSIVAVSTEILSLLSVLSYPSVSLLWFCLLVSSAGLLLKQFSHRTTIRQPFQNLGVDKEVILLATAIIVIVCLNLFVALLSPPNNWDSMTYHMSRVAHWIQNQSVAFYPTAITRQNHSMPLAEYAITHLQLLSHSDCFANLIQWYSYLVCILAATLLVKRFTTGVRAQCFAGLFVATLPMAILQSTSTQNDLVTSAFCLLFVYFLLRLTPSESKLEVVPCAMSLGLGLLTKGTAYIFCAAGGICITMLILLRAKDSRIRLLLCGKLMVVVVLALVLNVGYYTRNFQLYGHPLSTETGSVLNEAITPKIVAANLVKNIVSQLATPFAAINEVFTEGLRELLPDEIDNPMSTFGKSKFAISFSLNEDLAGNFPHLLLVIVALVLVPFVRTGNRSYLYALVGVSLLSLLLFSSLLKWQPWGSRLLTPFFLLTAPLVSIAISQRKDVCNRVLKPLAIALILYSIPFVLMNSSRPLIPWRGISLFNTPRNEMYFVSRRDLYTDYLAAASLARNKKPNNIGVLLSRDQYEYPLWVFLERHAVKGRPLIEHISVENISRHLESKNEKVPSLVLVGFKAEHMNINGIRHEAIYTGGTLSLLEAKDD